MENSHAAAPDLPRGSADGTDQAVVGAAGALKATTTEAVRQLIADVEDLVARVAKLKDKDADMNRVRGKVEQALAATKQSLASGTASLRRRARYVADSTDGYVHENPWQALGMAALFGVVAGFVIARRP